VAIWVIWANVEAFPALPTLGSVSPGEAGNTTQGAIRLRAPQTLNREDGRKEKSWNVKNSCSDMFMKTNNPSSLFPGKKKKRTAGLGIGTANV